MKKRIYSIILIILAITIMAAFSGCRKKQANENTTAPKHVNVTESNMDTTSELNAELTSESKQSKKTEYPITVTDCFSNEVTIESEPLSISSMALGSDEILLSIADKSSIRSLSPLAEMQGLSNIIDQIEGIEILGTNSEMIIAAQPDLVIVTDFTDSNFIQQIKDAGITVYAFKTPGSIEDVKEVINDLAYILNVEEKGAELINWMDQKLNAVKSAVGRLEGQVQKALSLDSFYYTYGKGTTFDSIASHAGVENLASSKGLIMWVQLSKEQVVETNPDMILLPSWSYEGFDAEKFVEEFKTDPSLAGINAVKNNKVYALPEAHMTSVSQNMVLGVEDLAKAAYPERFAD